ncbi:hypothetical protein [Halococcus saccharolyticus]|uniref:Uncharacterized protein n=1 Tax=Halococcus saccharolyticus DSM 5350 TaxID=1227455 RepID=M0MNJ9_9EURY|nr:hypothetical protein [Halococcus saccharolyticus]EMA46943.1 hypothetical protein C449_02884 [Halococcus saccharolyticus DSM 5350]
MSDAASNGSIRDRSGGDRLRLWLLLDADRRLLTGLLTFGLFLTIMIVGAINTTPLRVMVREGTHLERLFQSFTMSLITGITIVVGLNQLVLSQEMGSLDEQRDRMAGAMEFRLDAEELIGSVTSPEPGSFMRTFVTSCTDHGTKLQSVTDGNTDRELRDDIADLVDRLHAQSAAVDDRLDDAQFGRFEVVRAILNYNYSWLVYRTRSIRAEHAESLDEDERAAFDDLVEVLELFGPARQHFKALYFRWELVNFSRTILYIGVPALAISILSLVYLDPNSFPGTTAGVDNLVLVVSAATAVAATPFFLVVAYIVRLGTIAKRTLTVGPFVLRDAQQSGDLDLEG